MKKHRNPIATAPILRKGGVHGKSRSAERIEAHKALQKEVKEIMTTRQTDYTIRGSGSNRIPKRSSTEVIIASANCQISLPLALP